MKQLKLSLVATIMTLALATSTFAGDMQCGIVSQPPPPQTNEANTTAPSEIQTGDASTDPVTDVLLIILQDVLLAF